MLLKNSIVGGREVTLERVDPGWIASTNKEFQKILYPFRTPREPGTYVAHISTCRQTPIHITIIINKNSAVLLVTSPNLRSIVLGST